MIYLEIHRKHFWQILIGQQNAGTRDDIELDRKFAEKLNQAMAGYQAKLQPDDEVIILSVDAATTGRLAVTYYQEVRK